MTATLPRLRSVLRFLAQRFREDQLARVAGSLTFTTLFALVPLATVVFTVFSALPVSSRFTNALHGFVVANLVPGAASKLITVYTQQFVEKASNLTAIGVGLLVVTAVMLMLTIDDAFNRIWRVRRRRPLMKRLLVYWAALTVGPLLIGASVYLTSWLVTVSLGLIDERGARATLMKLVAMLLTCVALALLYATVPNRRVRTSEAIFGGIAAGLAFEAMKAAFAWFVTHIGNYRLVYGAFAGFPVFLLWLYVSWLIVLAGAVVTAALPALRTGVWTRPNAPGARLVGVLAMLRALAAAHALGETVDATALARAAKLTLEDAEARLERMAARGWVAQTDGGRWVLARDPRALSLAECYDEFVWREGALDAFAATLGVGAGLPRLEARDGGAITLEDLCRAETGART